MANGMEKWTACLREPFLRNEPKTIAIHSETTERTHGVGDVMVFGGTNPTRSPFRTERTPAKTDTCKNVILTRSGRPSGRRRPVAHQCHLATIHIPNVRNIPSCIWKQTTDCCPWAFVKSSERRQLERSFDGTNPRHSTFERNEPKLRPTPAKTSS